MKTRFLAFGLAPALALGACAGSSDDTANNLSTMESPRPLEEADNSFVTGVPATAGQAFADMAAASDAFEIEAGKLAQQKATSQPLKDFGKMMVDGHTASTTRLKDVAGKAAPAILPNPALSAEQEANLATLRDTTGADFDTAYKAQQVAAHQKALAAMKDYAANGDVPGLKQFAGDKSKVVQMHLDKIKGM